MRKVFTIQDLEKSACWDLNPHLHKETVQQQAKSKYGNKKVPYDGMVFDSKKECLRYQQLKLLQQIGEISELKCQAAFQLSTCKYIADFTYQQNGQQVVEDVKSVATAKLPLFRLKAKMMKSELDIDVQVV